jgi:hypothetical protein
MEAGLGFWEWLILFLCCTGFGVVCLAAIVGVIVLLVRRSNS